MSARSSTLPVLDVNALYKYSSLKLLNRLTFDPIFVCTLLVIIANRGLKISVVQCRWVLLMLQPCTHSRHRPTSATDEKTRKVLSILVVISVVGTISGKSLNLLPPDVVF